MQRSINEEFDRFGRRFGVGSDWVPMFGPPIPPAVNVTEKDDVVHVEPDLPGMDTRGIEVSAVDDLLTLKGERKEE